MAQIELENKLGNQRCPGEETCTQVRGMPLYGYEDDDEEIERICTPSRCKLAPTKPGSQPAELSQWIAAALRLDSAQEMGGTFAYPEALSPREWVALEALSNARNKVRMKELAARNKEAERAREEARLRGMGSGR